MGLIDVTISGDVTIRYNLVSGRRSEVSGTRAKNADIFYLQFRLCAVSRAARFRPLPAHARPGHHVQRFVQGQCFRYGLADSVLYCADPAGVLRAAPVSVGLDVLPQQEEQTNRAQRKIRGTADRHHTVANFQRTVRGRPPCGRNLSPGLSAREIGNPVTR